MFTEGRVGMFTEGRVVHFAVVAGQHRSEGAAVAGCGRLAVDAAVSRGTERGGGP